VPAALLLGTPTLTLVGSIGAALLVGSRRGSVLMALLVLPLYIPVLIFGVAAVESQMLGLGGSAPFLILAAMLLAALALTPLATAAALRLALE
jgi:heme exporter protein B